MDVLGDLAIVEHAVRNDGHNYSAHIVGEARKRIAELLAAADEAAKCSNFTHPLRAKLGKAVAACQPSAATRAEGEK